MNRYKAPLQMKGSDGPLELRKRGDTTTCWKVNQFNGIDRIILTQMTLPIRMVYRIP